MKAKLYITRSIKLLAFALAVISTTYLLQTFLLNCQSSVVNKDQRLGAIDLLGNFLNDRLLQFNFCHYLTSL